MVGKRALVLWRTWAWVDKALAAAGIPQWGNRIGREKGRDLVEIFCY